MQKLIKYIINIPFSISCMIGHLSIDIATLWYHLHTFIFWDRFIFIIYYLNLCATYITLYIFHISFCKAHTPIIPSTDIDIYKLMSFNSIFMTTSLALFTHILQHALYFKILIIWYNTIYTQHCIIYLIIISYPISFSVFVISSIIILLIYSLRIMMIFILQLFVQSIHLPSFNISRFSFFFLFLTMYYDMKKIQ